MFIFKGYGKRSRTIGHFGQKGNQDPSNFLYHYITVKTSGLEGTNDQQSV